MFSNRRGRARVPRFAEGRRDRIRGWFLLQLPPSNRTCGSPAPGSQTPFTAGVRRELARAGSAWGDNDAIEGDQAEAELTGDRYTTA